VLRKLAERLLVERRRCKTVFQVGTLINGLFSKRAVACNSMKEAFNRNGDMSVISVTKELTKELIMKSDIPENEVLLLTLYFLKRDQQMCCKLGRLILGLDPT
jgi:hypothetical protein